MTSDELEGTDINSLMRKLRKTPGSTVASRRAAERKAMTPNDGRRMRATGRTAQLNLKVRDDTKETLYGLARDDGLMMVAVVEQALTLYRLARHHGLTVEQAGELFARETGKPNGSA